MIIFRAPEDLFFRPSQQLGWWVCEHWAHRVTEANLDPARSNFGLQTHYPRPGAVRGAGDKTVNKSVCLQGLVNRQTFNAKTHHKYAIAN